jgi:hypothetical protein
MLIAYHLPNPALIIEPAKAAEMIALSSPGLRLTFKKVTIKG